MRAIAVKYSDLGDHEKALNYLERAEKKAEEKLPREHIQVLLLQQTKVEFLLKKLRLGTEQEFM